MLGMIASCAHYDNVEDVTKNMQRYWENPRMLMTVVFWLTREIAFRIRLAKPEAEGQKIWAEIKQWVNSNLASDLCCEDLDFNSAFDKEGNRVIEGSINLPEESSSEIAHFAWQAAWNIPQKKKVNMLNALQIAFNIGQLDATLLHNPKFAKAWKEGFDQVPRYIERHLDKSCLKLLGLMLTVERCTEFTRMMYFILEKYSL